MRTRRPIGRKVAISFRPITFHLITLSFDIHLPPGEKPVTTLTAAIDNFFGTGRWLCCYVNGKEQLRFHIIGNVAVHNSSPEQAVAAAATRLSNTIKGVCNTRTLEIHTISNINDTTTKLALR